MQAKGIEVGKVADMMTGSLSSMALQSRQFP